MKLLLLNDALNQGFTTLALLMFGTRWCIIVRGCPVHRRMLSSIHVLCLLETSGIVPLPVLNSDNQKCFQTLPNISFGGKKCFNLRTGIPNSLTYGHILYSLQDVLMYSFQYLKSVRHIQVDFGINMVAFIFRMIEFDYKKEKKSIPGKEREREIL